MKSVTWGLLYFSVRKKRKVVSGPKYLTTKRYFLSRPICGSNTRHENPRKNKQKTKDLAGGSFDPPTFGLWAQHASSAPTRFSDVKLLNLSYINQLF
jgi:hypothetical protein